MGWVLRLVDTGVEGSGRSVDVMMIDRPGDLGDIADLGLTLAQGKQLVALVQQAIVTAQSRDHAVRRPECRTCGAACQVKDYRPHQIATLFGQVVLRLPRFRCAGCGGAEAGHDWPAGTVNLAPIATGSHIFQSVSKVKSASSTSKMTFE